MVAVAPQEKVLQRRETLVPSEHIGSTQADHTAPYDDLNTPMIALAGFVSAIVTFVCIFGLQAAYLQYDRGLQQSKVVDVRLEKVETALDSQKSQLTSYAWINREAGTVKLPIDRAMDLVVRENSQSN
jgi:hypothetical protein